MVVDLAARPRITAGVALAAGIITVAPVTQHLPDRQLAQQLWQVSLSNIRLTDAASGMVDLFSGVESELASLASGASAAAVPAGTLSDVFSPIAQNLIVQTYVTTFQNLGTNLRYILNGWSKVPFPVAQQVAANFVQYASDYVGDYQSAARGVIDVWNGVPAIESAVNEIMSGKIQPGFLSLWSDTLTSAEAHILLPLEAIPQIPGYALQNLTNGYNYAATTMLTAVGGNWANSIWEQPFVFGLGTSLQNAYNAWEAGDTVGAVTNLINTPGAMLNAFLNGTSASKLSPPSGGVFSSGAFVARLGAGNGFVQQWLTTILPGLAKEIVAPNAQNVANGGGLGVAIQDFANQLINGWPNLTPVINGIGGQLTALLQSIPSVLSNLPSMLANFGGALASNIGSLVAALLKLL
ncbi:hypothetical protein K3U93_21165 [Mycobacterium malmoense]|uniref:PE-PGRS family protein n=1 Tax=Mycobacterium malmoense TaxID=1780 RepID=A0ABX3SV76_MYCMA|nr:hypothetical protein [Mycobacterium malmoense]ORA84430.1 hypothetical protein BST29_05295 [Mycobacterium malmoense]QZA17085.1 hypothetical protein K3U93_21165 [Mycobacterium malmoense]